MSFGAAAKSLTPVPSPIAPPTPGRGGPPPKEAETFNARSFGGEVLSWQAVLDDLAVQAAGGTVAVRGPAGDVELTGPDLADAADRIARLVPPGKIRDILVLGGSLEDPATRALLSWATVAGAALLLEPDPGNVVGMAVWARPTVFAGSVDDVARLRLAAQRHDRSWLRRLARKLGRRPDLPFGRLRALLLTGPEPLPQEDENDWRQRGVSVGFLPQCGIAWYISRRGDRHA
ncbi:MAG TPA: hypothetical protein VGK45_15590 [Thermoanaerobaculia bacterium]